LNENEKNASVNAFLQHSTQDQLKFFQSVIATMIAPEAPKATPGRYLLVIVKLNG